MSEVSVRSLIINEVTGTAVGEVTGRCHAELNRFETVSMNFQHGKPAEEEHSHGGKRGEESNRRPEESD